MKNIIAIAVVIILLAGIGIYFFTGSSDDKVPKENIKTPSTIKIEPVATTTTNAPEESIGRSVEGRDIMAYHFGTGSTQILLIGGIHGGYEWNTSLVAFEAIDYFKANPRIIPSNVKVTVIPVLNPDGLYKTIGVAGRFSTTSVPTDPAKQVAGRFNANTVDLNRNFDCDWKKEGTWQNKTVSGGTAAFSEPESKAIKNYIETKKPTAVIVWYSSAGGVFASNCHNGVLSDTNTLLKTFSDASGFKAYQDFNFYEITGDMVNWLAKINVPAISVLLTNHKDTEWTKNQKGIDAVLKYYSN